MTHHAVVSKNETRILKVHKQGKKVCKFANQCAMAKNKFGWTNFLYFAKQAQTTMGIQQ